MSRRPGNENKAGLVAAITAETREDAESAWREFTSHTSDVVLQQDFSVPGEVRLRQIAGEPAGFPAPRLVPRESLWRSRLEALPAGSIRTSLARPFPRDGRARSFSVPTFRLLRRKGELTSIPSSAPRVADELVEA